MHKGSSPDHSYRVRRKPAALPVLFRTSLDIAREARHPIPETPGEERDLSPSIATNVELSGTAEQALQIIADDASEATGAHGTAIAIARGEEIVCCARAGVLAPPLGTVLNTTSGLSGECLRTGEVICCGDTETDPRVDREACRQAGIRAALAVPLRRGQSIVGVMTVSSFERAAFGVRELRQLQVLADLAAEQSPGDAVEVPVANEAVPATEGDTAEGTRPQSEKRAAAGTNPLPWARAKSDADGPRSAAGAQRVTAGTREITNCLERIRNDAALRLLGRAKAYLRIEALYDGEDRSHAIDICDRLMLERAADIGAALKASESGR